MKQLICETCGTVNESGSLHCRQCGGKLAIKAEKKGSKAGRAMSKLVKWILWAVGIVVLLVVIVLCLLLFKTSGFPELKVGVVEIKKIDNIVDTAHKQFRQTHMLNQDEANVLAAKLLEKGGIDKESETKMQIFYHIERKTVSVVLYSKILDTVPTRCELGFRTKDDNEPELKYARFGMIFMPGFLREPVVKFFEHQALNDDNKKLVGRVEQMYPQGKDQMIFKLEKD